MGLKNFEKAQVLRLGNEVEYQPGQIVSKTLAQNRALSMTLFAFEQDEEISTHTADGDALVTVSFLSLRQIAAYFCHKNIFTHTIRYRARTFTSSASATHK